MDMGLLLGLGIFLVAGIGNGAIAFPQKFVKKFAWENTWGTFYLLTMVVIPALVIPFCVNDIWGIWSAAGSKAVMVPILLGLLWGVGCITFGASIHMVGLSLGFTLIMGIVLGLGSLLPLAVLHPEKLTTASGYVILLGIAISILGVVLVGYAGYLKSQVLKGREEEAEDQKAKPASRTIILGIIVSVLSGVTSSCLNLGFAFSQEIPKLAIEQFNVPAWAAGLASWQLVFWGGFITCGIFCAVLMIKNGTWRKYAQPGAARDGSLSLIMAILHFVVVLLYGVGAYYIGDLGTSLGFAAFMSLSIVIANVLGFLTGEWKDVGARPVKWIIIAMVVLIISVCVLGIGNSL